MSRGEWARPRRYNLCVRILISAGEASGEMYGAQLMEALQHVSSERNLTPPLDSKSASEFPSPQIEFFGAGGEKMRAAGCEIVVDAKHLSVVGITEIVSHLPKIWSLFHKLTAEADKRRPDVAIVIDSPAFNWRVARQMKKRGILVVYYVCPQFWAWRQGRVRLLRKYVDKALVIFPFEEKFYRDRGVHAEFVGHPLATLSRPTVSREEYAREYGLDSGKPWITLMPGSRKKEVRMNLFTIVDAVQLLGEQFEYLLPVAPGLNPEFLYAEISEDERGDARIEVPNIHLVSDALPALANSRAGIIASGTATVEAAMMETPFVMVYRVTPLTYLLGRWTVKVPHFAMVNLIACEEVVRELVQQEFTAEKVAAEMARIVPEGEARAKMIAGLRRVKEQLRGGSGQEHAAEKAAEAIIRLSGIKAETPA